MIGGLTTMTQGGAAGLGAAVGGAVGGVAGAAVGAAVGGALGAVGASSMPSGILGSMNPFDLRTIDVCHNFAVFINGLPVGEFHAVEGLTRSVSSKTFREGGHFAQERHLIEQHTFGDLTLKWGLVQRGYMFNWMEEVKPGNLFRRDLVIMMQDRALIPTRVFSVVGAYPVEWTSPNMDASTSAVPIETLKLRYHSMSMVARHVI